jgi:hypothetical protein
MCLFFQISAAVAPAMAFFALIFEKIAFHGHSVQLRWDLELGVLYEHEAL